MFGTAQPNACQIPPLPSPPAPSRPSLPSLYQMLSAKLLKHPLPF